MDLMNLGLVALVVIGTVNVIGFFKPLVDSRIKIAVAFVVALVVTFIPQEFQNVILQHVQVALSATLAGSGLFKLTQNTGAIRNTTVAGEIK